MKSVGDCLDHVQKYNSAWATQELYVGQVSGFETELHARMTLIGSNASMQKYFLSDVTLVMSI